MTDLLVVGGGPAGLFGALRAAERGLSVRLLEKNPQAGKKLLVTGSGQCNLTHGAPLETFYGAYGNRKRFVRPALLNFPPAALQDFFRSRGVHLITRPDGKVFPASLRAGEILQLLLGQCRSAGVEIMYKKPVTALIRNEGGFAVTAGGETLRSRLVLLACGGASWPGTGSTGDGYPLAAWLGHRIIPPRPALTTVYPKGYDASACAGLALPETLVTFWRSGRKTGERTGDILFTHKGLSGPGILDSSRDLLPGDELHLRLTDSADKGEIDRRLLAACAGSPRRALKNLLSGFGLPESLTLIVLKRCGIVPDTTGAALTRKERVLLAENLFGFRFIVKTLGGFNEAMATAGGVDTDQVNPKTMESRLVPGLFLAGEILDVDGDTGGFNLQFAFSSAALAAAGMSKPSEA